MLASAHPLALPRGWPCRVRSAAVHAISLSNIALTTAFGWAAQSLNPRLRLRAELERLRQEIHLRREEIRIKDARMQHIEPQKRPPTERLAILELRAARGWSLAQTARAFLVTPLTVTSWTARLDEEGPDALVRLPEPVNRFPGFVGYLVRRLKTLCPTLGKVKIAQVLARAGLHLGPTTVRRMLQDARWPRTRQAPQPAHCTVTAKKPNNLWHLDLTTVPTTLGFWTSWSPFALSQVWPFCWWVAVAVDHCSRRLSPPCTMNWPSTSPYNGHRPHSRLGAATPDEVYHHRRPAVWAPRFEPRPRWPQRFSCASPPQTLIRGQPGVVLHLAVGYQSGRGHLPIVTLERAA